MKGSLQVIYLPNQTSWGMLQGFLQVILQEKTCTATLTDAGLCYYCNDPIYKYHWSSATWRDYIDPTGMLWPDGAEAMLVTDSASVIDVMSSVIGVMSSVSGAPRGGLPGMPGLQPVQGVSQDEE